MPASMISAPTGSMPKVIGNSMVMVAIGPTPGSTPIRVPIMQPMKHRNTFLRESATLIPSERLPTRLATKSNTAVAPLVSEQALDSGQAMDDRRPGPCIGVVDRRWDQTRRIERDRQVEQLLEHEAA